MSMFRFFCCNSDSKEENLPKEMQEYWNKNLGSIISKIRTDFRGENPELSKSKKEFTVDEKRSVGLLEASKRFLALGEEVERVQRTGINEALTRLASEPEKVSAIYASWKGGKKMEAFILLLEYGKEIIQEENTPTSQRSLSIS